VTDDELPDVIVLPITWELDLHPFRPAECGDVVTEYLEAAWEAGLRRVRVIHGKGTGALRRTVQAALDRHPRVGSYDRDDGPGGWGATVVLLRDGEDA